MSDGWSFSPWSLSPWAAEPDRAAAGDLGRMGGGRTAPSLADVLQPPVPVGHPDDYDPASWFEIFVADWPTVDKLIPLEDQVLTRDDDKVRTWVNRQLPADGQRTSINCNDRARYQLHIAGFTASGAPARDSRSFLVIREHRQPGGGTTPELQLDVAVGALSYLRRALTDGMPVMIGVKLDYYDDEPNNIYGTPYVIATDHYVVGVGSGLDNGTPYVDVYDYLAPHRVPRDRLHLSRLLTLDSPGALMRMIELRRSDPRPGSDPAP